MWIHADPDPQHLSLGRFKDSHDKYRYIKNQEIYVRSAI